jgi:hypothetical protein
LHCWVCTPPRKIRDQFHGYKHTSLSVSCTSVVEAVEVLGISAEAVRGRIRRGTLPLKQEGETIYVLLDAPLDNRTTDDQPNDRTEILIAELQDRVRSLEDANRENGASSPSSLPASPSWRPRRNGQERLRRPPRSRRGPERVPPRCPRCSGGHTAPAGAKTDGGRGARYEHPTGVVGRRRGPPPAPGGRTEAVVARGIRRLGTCPSCM